MFLVHDRFTQTVTWCTVEREYHDALPHTHTFPASYLPLLLILKRLERSTRKCSESSSIQNINHCGPWEIIIHQLQLPSCTVWDEFLVIVHYIMTTNKVNVRESRNRPGVTQRVPGGLGPQISMTFGTWRWWSCQAHTPVAFTPGKVPGTHFH